MVSTSTVHFQAHSFISRQTPAASQHILKTLSVEVSLLWSMLDLCVYECLGFWALQLQTGKLSFLGSQGSFFFVCKTRGIMSKGTACSDPKGVAASVCTRLVSPAGPDTAQSPARDPFNSFHLHVAGSDFNQGCTPDARDLNLVQLLLWNAFY